MDKNVISLRKPTGHAEISISHGPYWSGFMDGAKRINKPEIIKMLATMKPILKGLDISFVPDGAPSLLPGYIRKFLQNGANSMKREQLDELYVGLGQDLNNVKALAEGGAPRYIEAWRKLVTELVVTYPEMTKILGHRPPVEKPTHWAYAQNAMSEPMLLMAGLEMPHVWGRPSEEEMEQIEFFLPQLVRYEAAKVFFPADALNAATVPELPAGLVAENFEEDVNREISKLMAIGSSGKINAATDSVTAQKIKSLTSKVAFTPFSGLDDNPEELSRSELVAVAYLIYYISLKEKERLAKCGDLGAFARFLVSEKFDDKISGTTFKFFLPKLDGFKKSWAGATWAPKILGLVKDLIRPAKDGWMDMSNFRMRYLCSDTLISKRHAFTPLFGMENNRTDRVWRKSDVYKSYREMKNIDWWKEVTYAFVINYLRFLSAVGLLELGIDGGIGKSVPADDDIRYVRMTPLGRYAFGYDREYHPRFSLPESTVDYDLDPLNPILTISGGESPYVPFLSDLGERLSATRFKITPQTIVAKAENAGVVESRISIFRSLICPEPKGIWKEILDEAARRANVAPDVKDDYIIQSLDLTVPGLLDLVNLNEEIQARCLRAEGSLLLVPSDFYTRFCAILHSAGYLV